MKKYLYVLSLLLTVAVSSCKKTQTEEADLSKIENPNPPQNNNLIQVNRIIGADNEKTTIQQILNAGDNNLYYRGYYDSGASYYQVSVDKSGSPTSANIVSGDHYEIGKMKPDGTKIWGKLVAEENRCMTLINSLGSLRNSIAVMGYNRPNTIISLYSSDGVLRTKLAISKQNSRVWFNDISVLQSTTNEVILVAVGGITDTVAQTDYPYIAKFRLTNTNGSYSFSPDSEQIITSLSGNYFVNLGISGNSFLTTMENKVRTQLGVCKLTSNYTLEWSKIIQNSWGTIKTKIIVDTDKFYISGNTDDKDKKTTSTGEYWSSGLVVCFKFDGTLLWQTKIALSNKGERVSNITKEGNFLYLVGEHSGVCYLGKDNECQSVRGNGLITKIDATNGNILKSYSFGDKFTRSEFYSNIILPNNLFVACGYTNNRQEKASWQGWVININLSDL